MADRRFIRPRPESPLRPSHLRRGRSFLGLLGGGILVAAVGIVGFATGYPTGATGAATGRETAVKAPSSTAVAGEQIREASDRTRPDFLAKLAAAPPTPVAQDPSPSGLESAALIARIEAAAETTGSIAPLPKKVGRAPDTSASALTNALRAGVGRSAASTAREAPPTATLSKQASVAPAQAAIKPKGPPAPKASPVREAKATGGFAAFFRRAGSTKGLPPPDPAR